MTRIGIFGGTFDPIHHGHLVAAEECRARLDLGEVLFVPAGQPPHKRGQRVSPAPVRQTMVELAIATNPAFRLSRVELDRPGPSYSVNTVARLQAELGDQAELFFIIGMDSLADLLQWHEPGRLLMLCQIVAVTRPGVTPPDLGVLEATLPGAATRITILPVPRLDIAASDLRRRVASGLPIKYQVPEPVEAFILQTGLYRTPDAARPAR